MRLAQSILVILATTSLLTANARADEFSLALSAKQLHKRLGTPNKSYACPLEGAELRFRREKGRVQSTGHLLGRCFQTLGRPAKGVYRLWIPAADAVLIGFINEDALAPMLARPQRLGKVPIPTRLRGTRTPGVYPHIGTPLHVQRLSPEASLVQLPVGDVVAQGWLPSRDLRKTVKPRKATRFRGKRRWLPGLTKLLDAPGGEALATIHSPDQQAAVVRIGVAKDEHELVVYVGEFATAIGWVHERHATDRPEMASDLELGIASDRKTSYWVEAGATIHSHLRGDVCGVFTRDTEVRGRVLKNGWVQLPLTTDAGTFAVWSPIEGKQ